MNNDHAFSRKGILFVVSAPSGAGKTTLCQNLRQSPDFVYSVSYTTRPARPGETHGEDYFFVDERTFDAMNAKGEFLEFAQVHGYCYGTPKQPILNWIEAGTDALLDIDVQGARQIRANGDPRIQGALADVFIMPSTIQELERRLRKRRTESDEQIALRLKRASGEMMAWRDYKYMILSGTMEEDLIKFRAIMRAERYLSGRMLYHGTGF